MEHDQDMNNTALALATENQITIAQPAKPYVAPRRIDVPASVVRELLVVAGIASAVKVTLVLQPAYHCTSADVNWCDGHKDDVTVLTRVQGGWQVVTLESVSPWDGDRWGGPIDDNVAIIVYKHRGTRGWTEIVMAPTCAFLGGVSFPTEAPEMPASEATVLRVLHCIKSSYRADAYDRNSVSPTMLADAIKSLVARGYVKVNAAGAVALTTAGKNVARLLPQVVGL